MNVFKSDAKITFLNFNDVSCVVNEFSFVFL